MRYMHKDHLNHRIMQNTLSIPNSGRMPSIEQLPTQLQKPIAQLSQLHLIDTASAEFTDQTRTEISISIKFRNDTHIGCTAALNCFSDCDFKASYFLVDPKDNTMRLILVRKRFWLN